MLYPFQIYYIYFLYYIEGRNIVKKSFGIGNNFPKNGQGWTGKGRIFRIFVEWNKEESKMLSEIKIQKE